MSGLNANSKPSGKLVDSPLFWLLLFGAAALVGVLVIGPKYARRQARLNLQQEVREAVWKGRAQAPAGGGSAAAPGLPRALPRPRQTTLLPLLAIIGTLTLTSAALLAVALYRRRNEAGPREGDHSMYGTRS